MSIIFDLTKSRNFRYFYYQFLYGKSFLIIFRYVYQCDSSYPSKKYLRLQNRLRWNWLNCHVPRRSRKFAMSVNLSMKWWSRVHDLSRNGNKNWQCLAMEIRQIPQNAPNDLWAWKQKQKQIGKTQKAAAKTQPKQHACMIISFALDFWRIT